MRRVEPSFSVSEGMIPLMILWNLEMVLKYSKTFQYGSTSVTIVKHKINIYTDVCVWIWNQCKHFADPYLCADQLRLYPCMSSVNFMSIKTRGSTQLNQHSRSQWLLFIIQIAGLKTMIFLNIKISTAFYQLFHVLPVWWSFLQQHILNKFAHKGMICSVQMLSFSTFFNNKSYFTIKFKFHDEPLNLWCVSYCLPAYWDLLSGSFSVS